MCAGTLQLHVCLYVCLLNSTATADTVSLVGFLRAEKQGETGSKRARAPPNTLHNSVEVRDEKKSNALKGKGSVAVKISCTKWLLVTVWTPLGTLELFIANWTVEMGSFKGIITRLWLTRCLHKVKIRNFLRTQCSFFAVLKMEVNRCRFPWRVQCGVGDNPQGFGAECVCSAVSFHSCQFIFLCCLLSDPPPPRFSSLNNTSAGCSPRTARTRASEEERKMERKGEM